MGQQIVGFFLLNGTFCLLHHCKVKGKSAMDNGLAVLQKGE